MTLFKIIALATMLFLVYPLMLTTFADKKDKLTVFVSSIFVPFFIWIFIYLIVNGFYVVIINHPSILEGLMASASLYLFLQVVFILILRKKNYLKPKKML